MANRLNFQSGARPARGQYGVTLSNGDTAVMSMTAARSAAAQGLLASGPRVANYSRGAEILAGGGGAVIRIDLRDLNNLARRIEMIAVGIERGHTIIAQAINDGARVLQTQLKRKLQVWTGIKVQRRLVEGFRYTPATGATLTGMLVVRDRHIRITAEYFGAKWNRANPGGTHAAWGRPQIALHSFMIPGKMPLFKRVGSGRFPIAPLWGPNVAREIERHEMEVEADVVAIVRLRVLSTAERLMRMEIAKAGGR